MPPSLRLYYQLQSHWPPGAWIASSVRNSQEVVVHHGTAVTVHGDWFGELVWDGEYEKAEFDQTDLVYGSGGKCCEKGLKFVSSANTMDRLHYLKSADAWHVSNSLVCLMAVADVGVEPLDTAYRRRFESIIRGLDQFERYLHTNRGPVELVYHDNLLVSDGEAQRIPKPRVMRDLASYSGYQTFLISALKRCAANMRAPQRPSPYEWLGTVSTGFDSPTVAALAREAGLKQVVTFTRARGGVDDDGSEIAKILGLSPTTIERNEWQALKLPEIPFLASDGKGEDVYFATLTDRLDTKVLLTGYAAGAWSASGKVNQALPRADQSGLSLTEYRLWANFIHLPVPTMGIYSAQPTDMHQLAHDLDPWRSGQKYDKPFCRRVLEEEGVPAEMYGRGKKAASVLMFDRRTLLSPNSKSDFLEHLQSARSMAPLTGMRCQLRDKMLALASRCMYLGQLTAKSAVKFIPVNAIHRVAKSDRLGELAHFEPLVDYLFPWALEHAKSRYRSSSDAAAKPLNS